MILQRPQKGSGTEIHRAGWLIVDPETIIRDGYLLVCDGIVREVGQGRPPGDGRIVDHGPGVILPALVNAHTHLELSALQGKVTTGGGFRDWVRQVIRVREELGPAALCRGAEEGMDRLVRSGCGLVGEISTLGLTLPLFETSPLAGVWFREYLGSALADTANSEPAPSDRETEDVCISFAGHAPHTTAPDVLSRLKAETKARDLPFSIHLAESDDEMEFLTTGRGEWADFLTERGISFADWGLPVSGPVQHLERLGLLDVRTILVHLLHTTAADMEILRQNQVRVCLCPRSNRNLHNRLPDLYALHRAGLSLCIGTDSLAGTESLSLFDEMAFIGNRFPDLRPAEILKMATVNGAGALALENRFGTLTPGKEAAFVCSAVKAETPSRLLEAIIYDTASCTQL